jgi:hypothetical protein
MPQESTRILTKVTDTKLLNVRNVKLNWKNLLSFIVLLLQQVKKKKVYVRLNCTALEKIFKIKIEL